MTGVERDEMVAAAQARRDHDRLRAMQAELDALRWHVAALERSPSRRLFGPARHVLRAVQRLLRHDGPVASSAACQMPAGRGLALVIDNEWPRPDRDSGSMDIVTLMGCLRRLGFKAILAAAKQHEGDQPARDHLERQGIRCLTPADAPSVTQFIAEKGTALGLCVLCRVYCGGEFLELAQRHCRGARLVFNSIDLNYVREERRARLHDDEALLGMIEQLRAREEHIVRSCDSTMVVSRAEADLLAQTVPEALTASMPLAREIQTPATPFAGRRRIGFIGGFAHAPNLDAVGYLLAEIWPLVRRVLPGCTLEIVGAGAPDNLAEGCDDVRVLGHLPDVGPWFESLRLTVAPLRFGAGAKGKVASSLAAGVPCVATSVATEGMSLTEEAGVLVADNPTAFAAALARAYTDEPMWERLSAGALAYAGRVLSPDAWEKRLDVMLWRIGV